MRTVKIENAILNIKEGGAFQRLVDDYIAYKYNLDVSTPGSKSGSVKTITGNPDSFISYDDGTYTLIMHGTYQGRTEAISKIKKDILSCINLASNLSVNTKKIICSYTAEIRPQDLENIKKEFSNYCIDFVSLHTLAHDLAYKYPFLAKDHLGISIDTGQIMKLDKFIKLHKKMPLKATLKNCLIGRNKQLNDLLCLLKEHQCCIVYGNPGVGKTHLCIEAIKKTVPPVKNLYVIRDNDKDINDDLHMYLDNQDECFIYIDSPNLFNDKLKEIFEYLLYVSDSLNFKILISIDSFCKNRLYELVAQYIADIKMCKCPLLDYDNCITILNKLYKINNPTYATFVFNAIKGNIKLMTLLLNRKKHNFDNSYELYKHIYNKLLYDLNLDDTDLKNIIILEYIASLPNMSLKNAEFLSLNGFTEETIQQIKEKFLEMNIFYEASNDSIVMEDTNFMDYLYYLVFIQKQLLNINDFIRFNDEYLYTYVTKVVNSLLAVFPDQQKKSLPIMEQSIKACFETMNDDCIINYLYRFHELIPDFSLAALRDYIKQFSNVESKPDLDYSMKETLKKIIEIACIECSEHNLLQSLDLLTHIYILYPKMNTFLIDELKMRTMTIFSFNKGFENEIKTIDYLYQKAQSNSKLASFYIKYSDYILSTQYEKSQWINADSPTVNLTTLTPSLDERYSYLRIHAWIKLLNLYLNNLNNIEIFNVVANVCRNGLRHEKFVDFMKFDYGNIEKYLLNHLNDKDPILYLIACKYNFYFDMYDVELPATITKLNKNLYYQLLQYIMYDFLFLENINDRFFNHDNNYLQIIKNVTLNDFSKCFNILRFYCKANTINSWSISQHIDTVFKSSSISFEELFNVYYEYGCPFIAETHSLAKIAVSEIGILKITKILQANSSYDINIFIMNCWREVNQEDIDKKLEYKFNVFVLNQLRMLV
ncbi:MAG: hypothetical protein Q4E88_01705 [Coriobacteriia bacterium]|nr:hypothetical protein [Coriobacteriia bacterium]